MTTAPAAPARERHELIDALRGAALAGVFLVNLVSLSLYEFLGDEARAALPTAATDALIAQAMAWLVDVKAVTVFSLLFGLGFALQMDRPDASPARFARRLLVLAAIGALHGWGLWWGDILLTYALVGLLLLPWRHAPLWLLWSAGLVLALLVPPLLQPTMRGLLAGWPRQGEIYALALAGFSSPSPAAAWMANVQVANWARVANWALVCFVLGRFLLGAWAGRVGLLQRPETHRTLIVRIGLGALAAGLLATGLEAVQADWRAQWPALDTDTARYVIRAALRAGPLGLGIAWAMAFAWLWLHAPVRRWLALFAPAGRMALTNYLAQSAIGVALFYGVGAGIGPRYGLAGVVAAAALVFPAQMAFSAWWLRRFRFGPVEWLWRALTYGRRPPLRQRTSPAGALAAESA
jgi:uncharacterized protein